MVGDFLLGGLHGLDSFLGIFLSEGLWGLVSRGGVIGTVRPLALVFPLLYPLLPNPYDVNPFLVV